MLRTWFKRFFRAKQFSATIRRRQSRPASYLLRLETLEDRLAPAAVWTATGSLNTARSYDTATLLNNGDVLVAGGQGNNGFLSSAELYDPTTGAWSAAGSLNTGRYVDTATLLNNGEVLAAGGTGNSGTLSSAELYDPTTKLWSTTGSLNTPRSFATATLLNNGEVLVAGGTGSSGVLSSAELYNPASNSWSTTGSMTDARFFATATLLNNGDVLVAGGDGASGVLSSAELYDPTIHSWSATGSLNDARFSATATLLNDGEVLVAGGTGNNGALSSAELYNPTTGAWSNTGSLNNAVTAPLATLLDNGQVLLAGGDSATTNLANAELYDPTTGAWSSTANLDIGRDNNATMTLLNNGQVLVAGGNSGGYLTDSELFSTTPTINSPFTATFTYGAAASVALATLTDSPAPDVTTFTAGGLPSWASLNPNTGVLSGTPTAATVAPISITITASNGVAPNAVNTVELIVNPAPLLISAAPAFKFYGHANPTLSASYSGFVNGDTSSNLTGILSVNTTASAGSDAGNYPITVSGVSSSNYSITFLSGTMVVMPAPLTVEADNQTIVYGQAIPALTASYSGFVNGDTSLNLTGKLSLGTTATTGSGAGTYPITASGVSSSNYNIAFLSGTLSILPAPLTVSANSTLKVYGQANPTFTASYGGFVNGDTLASLTGALSLSTTATAGSGAGSYSITPSGLTSPNYNITYLNGTLFILQATDIITFAPIPAVPLGSSPIALNAVGGGSSSPVVYTVLSGPGNVSGSQLTISGLGTILIEATQAGDANYQAAVPVLQTVRVGTAQKITFTQPTTPVTFGVLPITLSGSASSKLPIVFSVISGPGTLNGSKLTVTGAGSIVIEADQAGNTTYAAAAPVQHVISVNKANQTITFAALSAVTYGAGPITLGAKASSNLAVTYTVVSGPGTVNGNQLTITGAGPIVIKATEAGNGNYNAAAAVTRTLTVNKAKLTVTANNAIWTKGVAGQQLAGFAITGFVNGDTQATLFGAEAAAVSCPTVNVNKPAAGAYVILITQGTLVTPANYTLTFRNGTLTVR